MPTERGLVQLEFFDSKILSCYDILDNYYSIDEYGNIFNVNRQTLLKPHSDKDGYLHLMLCVNERSQDGNHKRRDFRVASLVAKTYIGEPPEDMSDPTVDHKDGDVKNNHFSNLRWREERTPLFEKTKVLGKLITKLN